MRKLAVGLVVLALLLIGGDFALRFVATRQIGDAVRQKLGLPQTPSVSISGFPFVTQALNGQYDTISASLAPTAFGPVQNVTVNVDLIGVRIPLSDAIRGNADAMTAAGSQVRITIPVASVASALGLPDLSVQQSGGVMQLTTTITVLGQQFPISSSLDAVVADGTVALRAGVPVGIGATLPAAVSQAAGSALNLDIPLSDLPFAITRGSISAFGSNLIVDAATSELSFAAP